MHGPSTSIGIIAAGICAGCAGSGYVRVSEDVYIPRSVPSLELAAKEISSAREEIRSGEAAGSPQPQLSIAVNPLSGLEPEQFRILVSEGSVEVEGGGAAGAFYGALEAAGRIREGVQLALPRAGPRVARRIIRSSIDVPGLSTRPGSTDWPALLDRLASARWNTLAVPCGNPFPWLVRLSRFPKAFDAPGREAGARAPALRNVLQAAAERNIGLLIMPADLQAPDSFFRAYAAGREDRAPGSSLSKAYMRECVAEVLRAYPEITGIAVTADAIAWAPPGKAEEIVRAVFVEGIRASGRKAFLLISAAAAPLVGKLAVPPDIEVLEETDLPPSLLLCAEPPRPPASGSGPAPCGRLPLPLLLASPPLLDASALWVGRAAAAAPRAILLDLFDARVLSGKDVLLRRESFTAACLGLSAFEPGLREASWRVLWEEAFGPGSRSLLEPVKAVSDVWAELALSHRAERGWSPFTATESAGAQRGLGLRDSNPFVSIVELALSPSGDPGRASTAETVALEARGGSIASGRRTPLDAAAFMIERSEAAIDALESAAASAGTGPESALALEVEGAAHLGAYHARRIRASVFLLQHVAGIGGDARGDAGREASRALASWNAAEAAFGKLRQLFPAVERFPDLASLRSEAEGDLKTVEEARADPVGFRASPLFTVPLPLADSFDFERVRGFLHLGTGFLDQPPVPVTEDGQVFEAEELTGTWKVLREVAGFSGTGCISSVAAAQRAPAGMVLRVAIPRPGTFHVWVRGLAGGGESRAVMVRAGRSELGPTHERKDGAAQLVWEKAGQVDLPAGEVFLEIADAATGREAVDSIVLTRDGRWTPPRE